MAAIQAAQTLPDLESIGLRGQPTVERNDTLGQEDFLTLMTTQLQNQDPFKPMESGEFLGQMAQFATVNGITDLQTTVQGMAESFASSQALQAASLLGRQALVPGNASTFSAGEGMDGVIDLSSSVGNLQLDIYDSAGQLVRVLNLGPQTAGRVHFSWDGLTDQGDYAADGAYAVSARAEVNGKEQAFLTLMAARVESVSLGGSDGIQVNLAGLGAMPLSEIRELL
ncbi:MAG: flagellar hook assembly protein FlgD [Chromatiales bacterium]|nr:flagellar hook assembly protein FlgD [Chromatiales bacterium]